MNGKKLTVGMLINQLMGAPKDAIVTSWDTVRDSATQIVEVRFENKRLLITGDPCTSELDGEK